MIIKTNQLKEQMTVTDTYLSIDKVLVPPDCEGHHGVAVGHDDHRDDVLARQHKHVVVLVPPLLRC